MNTNLGVENRALRYLLWSCHPCVMPVCRYGDDGEMQCKECRTDFLRDSLETIGGLTLTDDPSPHLTRES